MRGLVRVLQRSGQPTTLGRAIAELGRGESRGWQCHVFIIGLIRPGAKGCLWLVYINHGWGWLVLHGRARARAVGSDGRVVLRTLNTWRGSYEENKPWGSRIALCHFAKCDLIAEVLGAGLGGGRCRLVGQSSRLRGRHSHSCW
jgi:hypothetical protein